MVGLLGLEPRTNPECVRIGVNLTLRFGFEGAPEEGALALQDEGVFVLDQPMKFLSLFNAERFG